MSDKREVFRRTLSSSLDQSGTIPTSNYKPVTPEGSENEPDKLVGTVVAERYLVLSVVSKGGMGVVYKCRQDSLDRTVALKLLPFEMTNDELVLERFNREAKVLSRLNHPALTTLYDFGRLAAGEPFFVVEFVEGETLSSLIKREGFLEYKRALTLFAQICEALGYAHKQGVIHRDLKPANIMLVKGEQEMELVKVLDFGIVKLTDESRKLTLAGEVWGTVIYMSPEQCAEQGTEQKVDARSDVFSLGSVLYECLTGAQPFTGGALMDIVKKLKYDTAAAPSQARADLSIPVSVDAVVLKAIEKEPDKRFQSMEEMAAALRGALEAPERAPVAAAPEPASEEPNLRFSHKISASDLQNLNPPPAPEPEPVSASKPDSTGKDKDKKRTSSLKYEKKPGSQKTQLTAGLLFLGIALVAVAVILAIVLPQRRQSPVRTTEIKPAPEVNNQAPIDRPRTTPPSSVPGAKPTDQTSTADQTVSPHQGAGEVTEQQLPPEEKAEAQTPRKPVRAKPHARKPVHEHTGSGNGDEFPVEPHTSPPVASDEQSQWWRFHERQEPNTQPSR